MYLTFACTPDKNHFCSEIDSNWKELQKIVIHTDENCTDFFTEFEELKCSTSNGKLKFDRRNPLKKIDATITSSQCFTFDGLLE